MVTVSPMENGGNYWIIIRGLASYAYIELRQISAQESQRSIISTIMSTMSCHNIQKSSGGKFTFFFFFPPIKFAILPLFSRIWNWVWIFWLCARERSWIVFLFHSVILFNLDRCATVNSFYRLLFFLSFARSFWLFRQQLSCLVLI